MFRISFIFKVRQIVLLALKIPSRRARGRKPGQSITVGTHTPAHQAQGALDRPNVTTADLTAEGRALYIQAYNEYTHDEKRYDETRKRLKELTNWVLSSVSLSIQETSLLPGQNVRQWFQVLAESGKVYDGNLMLETRAQYQAHLKALSKSPRKLEDWLQRWQNLMAKGIRHRVPETLETQIWTSDLLATISPILGNWASNFRMMKKREIQGGTINFREVAADILDEWTKVHTYRRPDKNIKAAFPALHGQEADPIEVDAEASAPEDGDTNRQPQRRRGGTQAGRGRGKRGGRSESKRKRQESNAEVESGKRCPACLLFHSLSQCYYAFPARAPNEWRPSFPLQELTKSRIKDNPSLEEEIKRLKKEMATDQES